MIETFWFVWLDEGEMWKNVVWKWQKCRGKVEEGDGDRSHLLVLLRQVTISRKKVLITTLQ